jgi:hypothetical protein
MRGALLGRHRTKAATDVSGVLRGGQAELVGTAVGRRSDWCGERRQGLEHLRSMPSRGVKGWSVGAPRHREASRVGAFALHATTRRQGLERWRSTPSRGVKGWSICAPRHYEASRVGALALHAITDHGNQRSRVITDHMRHDRLRAAADAAGGFGFERVFGPVVFGVAAAHVLAHIGVRAAPESREIARDLHGTLCG